MSTDIAVAPDRVPVALQSDPTGGRLVAWAEAASAAHQLAISLSATDFCPAQFRGKPGEATAAIIAGDELGLPPLAALRSIYVVHGTPALYARTMRALALSHGHEMWTEVATDSKVVVCGRRRGSDKVERREWTITRAQKAGYTSNKKYNSNPQEMLQAKADAEVARLIAADVLAGTPYSVEDLELEQPTTVTVSRTEQRSAKVSRKKAEPAPAVDPEPEPELDDSESLPADDKPASPPTERQLKKMFALLAENGLSDKADALSFVGGVIGHDIEHRDQLSADECSAVIDALNTEAGEPQ